MTMGPLFDISRGIKPLERAQRGVKGQAGPGGNLHTAASYLQHLVVLAEIVMLPATTLILSPSWNSSGWPSHQTW